MSLENSIAKNQVRSPERVTERAAVAPLVDIYENEDKVLLIADLPGVAKEHVNVHFEKGQLTLEARRTDAVEGTALAAEFRPFDYRRSFLVPQGIDAEKIVAELDRGVLRVHLPKAAALKPRRIEIKAS